jgi:hypothetical protein
MRVYSWPVLPERLTQLNINDAELNTQEKGYAAVLLPQNGLEAAGEASKGRGNGVWLLIAVVLPPIVAFSILYRQRISVPYHDDYAVILAFANDYRQLHGFNAKALDVATTQSNDYKLGFVHFVIALELELTGHLNFAFLITLGNLLLLAIAYLLWRVYRRDGSALNQQLLEFVPVSLLFFSLTYWESLNWAMAGLQNLSVIMFSLLAIYLLNIKGTKSLPFWILLLASASAVLAAFSSANGFLLAPVGLFLLLRRKAILGAPVWCAGFVLPLAAYRYHYVPFYVSVDAMHRSYVGKVAYVFGFLGCAIQERWVAGLLGLVIFAVLFLAVRFGFERTHPIPLYFSLWILLTASLVAWLRQGIASRYSIYSLLLLISCYWFLAQYLPTRSAAFTRKRVCMVSIVLAAVLCLTSDIVAYGHLKQRRERVLSGLENYRANPPVNTPMNDPETRQAAPSEEGFERDTLNRAIAGHTYTLPPEH